MLRNGKYFCYNWDDECLLQGEPTTPQIVRYPAEHDVVVQGQYCNKFYIITKGVVEIRQKTITGESIRLRTLVAGNYFGEIASLKCIARTATVHTITPCELLVLTRNEFIAFLEQNPRLDERIEQETVLLLRASSDI